MYTEGKEFIEKEKPWYKSLPNGRMINYFWHMVASFWIDLLSSLSLLTRMGCDQGMNMY